MTTRLTDEARGVLERSAITETTVTLPEQLPRELYMKVNAALTNAGGRWNRKARAHVFDRDPRAALGLALATGVSVDEKQLNQEFFTPPALALRLVETVGVSGMKVLEPSAGDGALVRAALRRGAASVTCYEKQDRLIGKLGQDHELAGEMPGLPARLLGSPAAAERGRDVRPGGDEPAVHEGAGRPAHPARPAVPQAGRDPRRDLRGAGAGARADGRVDRLDQAAAGLVQAVGDGRQHGAGCHGRAAVIASKLMAKSPPMQVQFDDRARPTTIFYSAAEWMSHITLR